MSEMSTGAMTARADTPGPSLSTSAVSRLITAITRCDPHCSSTLANRSPRSTVTTVPGRTFAGPCMVTAAARRPFMATRHPTPDRITVDSPSVAHSNAAPARGPGDAWLQAFASPFSVRSKRQEYPS